MAWKLLRVTALAIGRERRRLARSKGNGPRIAVVTLMKCDR